MDYIGHKCQACDSTFKVGDDVVVCPECGTPHHRECYINLGHCVNEDKHQEGFDYLESLKEEKVSANNSSTSQDENDFTLKECDVCKAKNPSQAFFCSRCGSPLNEKSQQNENTENKSTDNEGDNKTEDTSTPFSGMPNVVLFDPLAGVKPETDLGDSVTVGECAKFVKQNTPYFIAVFNNLKKFNRTRFNFCAAIFSGGYLLYRKMYKLGAIITAIEAVIMMVTAYLNSYINNTPAFTKVFEAYASYDLNAVMSSLSTLSTYDVFVFYLDSFLSILTIVISVLLGIFANRVYFKHCKKQINKIKSSSENPMDIDATLKQKGGVNTALALSLWFSYIVISYLPRFFY